MPNQISGYVFSTDLFLVNPRGIMTELIAQVELSVEMDNEEEEQSLTRLISSLPLESIVFQTLSQSEINQPVLVELLITNDETIRSLNKQFRNEDKATDVLSFPLIEKPIVAAPEDQLWRASEMQEEEEINTIQSFVSPPELIMHLGDIVISWQTVQRQAAQAGHSPVYELLFLLSHGILHLIGYDDQTEAGYHAMIRIQHAVMDTNGYKV